MFLTPLFHGSIRKFVSTTAFMICTQSASAITLSDFVSEVVQTNPQVLQDMHRYRQVEQERRISNKGWRPTVDLEASVLDPFVADPTGDPVDLIGASEARFQAGNLRGPVAERLDDEGSVDLIRHEDDIQQGLGMVFSATRYASKSGGDKSSENVLRVTY